MTVEQVNIPSRSLCYTKTVLWKNSWNCTSLIKLFIIYEVCWFILHHRGTCALFSLDYYFICITSLFIFALKRFSEGKLGSGSCPCPWRGGTGWDLAEPRWDSLEIPNFLEVSVHFPQKTDVWWNQTEYGESLFLSELLQEPLQVWKAVPGE